MTSLSCHPKARGLSLVSGWVAERGHLLALWGAMVTWSAAVFVVARSDYVGFRLGRFDLGNMVQAVWSTAQGRPLHMTDSHGEAIVRLAAHVDPILVLIAPLWIVLPTPLTLVGVQVAACALGALPVFWLGRRHLGSERAALLIALAYLAYPWLVWTAVDAIHPVTFAIPLLLFCIWFLDRDRLLAFSACALLALATGELIGLTVAALGLCYALTRDSRKGLVIAGAGAAWTFVALMVVVPAFAGGESMYYGFYESVGGSPGGLLRTAVTDPSAILSQVLDGNVLIYVLALGAPLGGLFLLAPALAAASLPQLALNVLADPAGPIDPRQHYLGAILPVLFAATVLGVARLRPKDRTPVVVTILFLCVVLSATFGPWPGAPARTPLWYQTEVSSRHVAALERALALIPAGAAVSASNRAGGHLAARRDLYVLPVVGNADWIVLDSLDLWLLDAELPVLAEQSPAAIERLRRSIAEDPAWTRVFAEDGVYVFRRRET